MNNQRPNRGGRLFAKGQSGNPAGRPKGPSLTELLKREIEKVCPTDAQGRTWKELIVVATMQLGIKGHPQALKEVWERLDGKVAQPIVGDVTNPIPFKLQVEFVRPDVPQESEGGKHLEGSPQVARLERYPNQIVGEVVKEKVLSDLEDADEPAF